MVAALVILRRCNANRPTMQPVRRTSSYFFSASLADSVASFNIDSNISILSSSTFCLFSSACLPLLGKETRDMSTTSTNKGGCSGSDGDESITVTTTTCVHASNNLPLHIWPQPHCECSGPTFAVPLAAVSYHRGHCTVCPRLVAAWRCHSAGRNSGEVSKRDSGHRRQLLKDGQLTIWQLSATPSGQGVLSFLQRYFAGNSFSRPKTDQLIM